MVIKCTGIVEFEPMLITKKHVNQSDWKKHALIKTNCDLERYYRWLLQTRFNLYLNKTLRGTHITIIADKIETELKFNEARRKYNETKIDFFYEIEPMSSGLHWWLRVHCPKAEDIREECGLSREPYFSFHLTLGNANEKNKEHSLYILEQCKKFELISSDPRKSLNEHEIIIL